MGSSHSAPRRPGGRRGSSRAFSTTDSPTASPRPQLRAGESRHLGDFGSSHSSAAQWPAEEELPSLMTEGSRDDAIRRREQCYGRYRGGGNGGGDNTRLTPTNGRSVEPFDSTPTLHSPVADARRDRLLGLSVIQSNRSLRGDELLVRGEQSFSTVADDSPLRRSRMANPRDEPLGDPNVAYHTPTPQSPQVWGGPPVLMTDGDSFAGEGGSILPHESTGEVGSRLASSGSSISDDDEHEPMTPAPVPVQDFFPQGSRHSEWMGRSIETLVLGYGSVAPILCLPEDEDDPDDATTMWGQTRRRSTVSTLGSDFGRRSSLGSFPGSRRGSLVGGGHMHGGTLANYYNRRRQNTEGGSSSRRGSAASSGRRGSASHGPSYRRRLSMNRGGGVGGGGEGDDHRSSGHGGPNVLLSLLAREVTGRPTSRLPAPVSQRLRALGGHTLFTALDRPAGGMCSEVAFLSEVIDSGDWAEAQTVISRISPRLIGDPSASVQGMGGERSATIDDPNLPPSASPYYAGGGRIGLERDAFVLSGGVDVLIRIFREPSFVGEEMARTYDARDLSEELVATRLAPCWNEALASLRELVYAIPTLVENDIIFDNGEFVPFLFTLLSHDSCFDGAAALIEEILSLQSHSPPQPVPEGDSFADAASMYQSTVRVSPATTFFLGNVPDLYKLWGGFNCRQLAHFCRILALLVFEPEDRQLLESPAVLKSIELLQLRRNRAARAGRDSTVDMNQAILLGDEELTRRLLKLLRVMNFAPTLRRSSPYHVMAHFPFIADTLVMLGLNELDNWDEIDRLEGLARKMLTHGDDGEPLAPDSIPLLSELGSVADMLESLSSVLLGNSSEPTNQLSHIIHVISAAQQAGVVVGRPRQGRPRRSRSQNQNGNDQNDADDQNGPSVPVDSNTIEGLASAAGILTDQFLVRRFYSSAGPDYDENPNNAPVQVVGIGLDGNQGIRDSVTGQPSGPRRPRISSPDDAANSLQFNALLLGPYQVEVLFVLCTLLGGRRKIDAQEMLNGCGVIPVLDDMFQRLPWDSLSPTREPISHRSSDENSNGAENRDGQQPEGIHGPGCECTPESALCVQYLRLLHNFCDRDCDNYAGRRLLLSDGERAFIFERPREQDYDVSHLAPGLLSKIIAAFIGESDESPYRFWLASCVESYLRGSSPAEQVFVARSGLLVHLIDDITSERLHCAGSLQTSFDLLGELCKGNAEVLRLLVASLDEESFRKLMSVAAANLVDSNVFIRSLLLSLERISSANRLMPLHIDPSLQLARRGKWRSHNGVFSRAYLTHSWWDTCLVNLDSDQNSSAKKSTEVETASDAARPSDWFPTMGTIEAYGMHPQEPFAMNPSVGLNDDVGHFGWVFSPSGDSLSSAAHAPNTVERLSWFLAANQTRLLRDLLGVVDLRNINHENICCLNTAVVIAIFAHRRQQLHVLLQDLRRMNDEERETKRRALDAARNDDVIDRAFVQAMKYLDIDRENPPAPYARRASLTRRVSLTHSGSAMDVGDRNNVMRNFREVLWFWFEYYTHRGRDRLSLEFSSHLRFQEWIEVVSLLGADDGSPTSLVRNPVRLPRSPYQRAARIAENPLRGV